MSRLTRQADRNVVWLAALLCTTDSRTNQTSGSTLSGTEGEIVTKFAIFPCFQIEYDIASFATVRKLKVMLFGIENMRIVRTILDGMDFRTARNS